MNSEAQDWVGLVSSAGSAGPCSSLARLKSRSNHATTTSRFNSAPPLTSQMTRDSNAGLATWSGKSKPRTAQPHPSAPRGATRRHMAALSASFLSGPTVIRATSKQGGRARMGPVGRQAAGWKDDDGAARSGGMDSQVSRQAQPSAIPLRGFACS